MKSFKRKICTDAIMALGLGLLSGYGYAAANVSCTNGTTINGVTVFGGGWAASNVCGNDVTITTSGSKTLDGGTETGNFPDGTNAIYYGVNGAAWSPFIFGDRLTATVNGSQVDVVRENGISGLHIISIGNEATLKAVGASSDVINVAQSPNGGAGYGKVLVGNAATISSEAGTAVRVNLTSGANLYNLAYIGEDAKISTKGNGDNSTDTVGYAVFAGNRDNVWTNGNAKGTNAVAVIGARAEITTSGTNAYAVFANKGGVVQLQGTSGASTIKTTGQGADALRAEKKINPINEKGFNNNFNNLGGIIELTGDVTITADSSLANTYALHTLGDGSLISSQQTNYYTGLDGTYAQNDKLYEGSPTGNSSAPINTADKVTTIKSGKLEITGDMLAESGLIDLRMTDGSKFHGNTALSQYTYSDGLGGSLTDAKGQIKLQISGASSIWQMTKDSELTDLKLADGANVYVGTQGTAITSSNQVTLTTENLSGNGIFHLRTNIVGSDSDISLVGVNISDKIKVTGTSSGNHKILINDSNTGGAVGTEAVRVAEIADGGAQFALANASGYVDIGPYRYSLQETAAQGTEKYWYLASLQAPVPPTPTTPVTPTPGAKTGTADHSANILNINYLLNYVEIQTLLQRMGELRRSENTNGDVWVRAYTGKLDSFTNGILEGFDMDYTGVQAGADKKFIQDNADFYLGGMIGTSKADANYKEGDGNTTSYHVGIYATYKANNGFYVDGIAKYTWMDNSLNAKTGGGHNVKGDGDTQGYSIGVETGKRFYFEETNTGWYVEPQAQLTFSHQDGATIQSSNTLRTDLDSYDSTLGRISAIIGYSIIDGANPVDVYFKTGYVKEFDGQTGYTYNHTDHEGYKFNGGWWDNGIGINAQINKKHNLYLDANYSTGSKFDQMQLNAGYRYSF